MKDWVNWYRNKGINIFPLKKREKVPQIAWDDFKKRETTEREVEEWLARGVSNFGAVCGSISNDLLVIDVDKKELFLKLNLSELSSETFTVRTGKGYHIYLRMPDPRKKGLIWEGHEEIRFQGEGKYVVAAGSRHPDGAIYEHLSTSPKEIKRPKEPKKLLDEIERRWRKYHNIEKLEEKRESTLEKKRQRAKKKKAERTAKLENFKNRISITDVIRRYVRVVNDYGTYWQGHCPFEDHEDRNPSFTVYEDTKRYRCFGCDRRGDVINFIKEIEGKSFVNAIERLEEITGEEYFKKELTEKEIEKEIYPVDVEEIIKAEQRFATLRDTEEVLHYENTKGGAWRFNGEVVIKEESEKILEEFGRKDKRTLQFVNEVVGHVKRSTYIDREQLNTEKKKINLLNGVYDLETEQLLPYDSGYYFTYIIPVRYDEQADCSGIKKFLSEILHEEDIQTVLQFIGYCLLPIMPYHKAMMFLGEGANGKSTLIELIRRFLGEKNTTSHALQSFIGSRFTTASLYGNLANLYADIPRDALRDTSIFKVLTGGDTLSAEKKFKESFSFQNTAKLIFSANMLPETFDDTEAFFRRWLLINFPNKFEGEQCDPEKLEKLTTPEELSGFFNLVLDALKQLLRDGMFHKSKTAVEIREEYIDKSKPVLSFVRKCLEFESSSFETKDDVYSAFVKFCNERKLPVVAKRIFSTRLPQYIAVRVERKRIERQFIRGWRGIRLKGKEEETYSCKGCGTEFREILEFKTHLATCDDFKMMQAQEAKE